MKTVRWVLALLASLIPIVPARGNPFTHVAHYVKTHKELLASDALFVAAVSADSASTTRFLAACPGCYETNPLLGRRPTPAIVWSYSSAVSGAFVIVNHLALYRYPRLDWFIEGAFVASEARLTYMNVRLSEDASLGGN